jgi:1-acyl-sn-glycerol-3-phosphate acyltransferase
MRDIGGSPADRAHPPLCDEPSDPAEIAAQYPLISTVTTFLARQDEETLASIQQALGREMAEAGDAAVSALCARLADAGSDWHHYPADPLARRIHAQIADRLLAGDSRLTGIEHVDAVAGRPVVICANHLSYSDANLLQILLERAGGGALAGRLTVMAGPKVYSSLKRRFSSLCFGTIKTPQSAGLSTEEAVMTSREVARTARRAIELAQERIRLGEALLIFGEGTRSRAGRMQEMLAGVSRYLEVPGSVMLPAGITGTERLFPIAEETLNPVRVTVRVGPPIDVDRLRARASRDRRLMMDVVGLAIAALLPEDYRGVYGAGAEGLGAARAVLADLAAG